MTFQGPKNAKNQRFFLAPKNAYNCERFYSMQPVGCANVATLSAAAYLLGGSTSGSQFLHSGGSVWQEGSTTIAMLPSVSHHS